MLYSVGGIFSCRACHDLAYVSTREDAEARCDGRIRRLAERLGSGGNARRGFLWTLPDKPAGMHWTTYSRLTRRLLPAHELRNDLFTASAAPILACGSGKRGDPRRYAVIEPQLFPPTETPRGRVWEPILGTNEDCPDVCLEPGCGNHCSPPHRYRCDEHMQWLSDIRR